MSIWRVPIPDILLPAEQQCDLVLLAMTVLGEAEGEPKSGKRAVAEVVINRCADEQARWPRTIQGVCLQRKQFSCFDDAHRREVMRRPKLHVAQLTWEDCFLAAVEAVYHYEPAYVGAANHYLNERSVMKSAGTLPSWADPDKITCRIGAHTFYAL